MSQTEKRTPESTGLHEDTIHRISSYCIKHSVVRRNDIRPCIFKYPKTVHSNSHPCSM